MFRRLGLMLGATWRGVFLDHAGRFDVQQAFFFLALAGLAYGAGLIFLPAGFLAPSLILTWCYLPARPPFVARPPAKRAAGAEPR